MNKPKRQRTWPTQAEWVRRDAHGRVEEGAQRLSEARKKLERMQIEPALVHIGYVRELLLETARDLERARDGEPDDLRLALDIIRDLRAGRPAENRADALLAQYGEIEL